MDVCDPWTCWGPPHPSKGGEWMKGEDAKELVPQSLHDTLEENTATLRPWYSLHPEAFNGPGSVVSPGDTEVITMPT